MDYPDPSWHSTKIEEMSQKSTESLKYIRDDAARAALAGESIDNPKTSQYWDEYHYACMELKKREST